MRLGTCRRSVVATATGLPRCARNDKVGTDEVGADEVGTLERWGGLTLLVVTDRIFALPGSRHQELNWWER